MENNTHSTRFLGKVCHTKSLHWQGLYANCTAHRLHCSQRDTTVWYVTIREQWMGLSTGLSVFSSLVNWFLQRAGKPLCTNFLLPSSRLNIDDMSYSPLHVFPINKARVTRIPNALLIIGSTFSPLLGQQVLWSLAANLQPDYPIL